MEHIYETDKAFVKEAMNELLKNTSLRLSEVQKLLIEELYSYMNKETLYHSLNCVKFADEYVKEYEEIEFEKDFNISKNDFLIAMAIHDVGKIMVPKKFLEKIGGLNDDEKKEIAKHATPKTGYSLKALNDCLETINKELESTFLLRDIGFSTKITNISSHHHPNRLKIKNMPDIYAISAIVDISEAATARRNYTKNENETEKDEQERLKEEVQKGLDWTSDNNIVFLENAEKTEDKESIRKINKMQSFVEKVSTNNARFFQKLFDEEDQKVKSPNLISEKKENSLNKDQLSK